MARIEKIKKDGQILYRITIDKKGVLVTETFDDEEEAESWAYHKEKIIDLISAYDPPLSEMITLENAIDMKVQEQRNNYCNPKEINYYVRLIDEFENFIEKDMRSITYDDLLTHYETLLNTPIRRGGDRNNESTGVKKMPAEATVFRKYQYLSLVYKLQIEMGMEIDNIPLKICQFRRKSQKHP